MADDSSNNGNNDLPAGAGGMQKLLHPLFVRVAEVPAKQLVLTTMGRPQREQGVNKLKAAIQEHGFLESHAPIVTLMSRLENVDTLEDIISDSSSQFKVIDGNHRVAAQQQLDVESGTQTKISVRVHQPMEPSVERLVAQGLNKATGTLVEQTLVDVLLWYRAEVADIQGRHGGTTLSEAQLTKKIRESYAHRGLMPPAPATVAKHLKIAVNFTEVGLAAMMDVTYLNNRGPKHQDHQAFDHKKLTKKMLERQEFLDMNANQQEVYVLRIARGQCKNQIYTKDELDLLDNIVVSVAEEIARVEEIAPREKWCPTFKGVMKRYLVKESPAKFKLHSASLKKQVAAYVQDLETGMTPCEDRKKLLLSQPHPHTCAALQEGGMASLWAAFEEKKKASDEKVASDKKKFLDEAKKDPAKKAAIEAGTAAKEAVGVAKAATDKAKTLTGKASEAAAAVSPTAATGAAGGATLPAGDSSSSSAPAPATSTTASSQPAAKESTNSGHDGKISTAKRKRAPSVKNLQKAIAKTEQWAKLRKEVTTIQSVDIFSSGFDSTARPLEVDPDSAMLIFVNIGADPDLLSEKSTERLHAGLAALESVLHPRGTLVMAMGSVANFDFPYIEERLKQVDLVMEKNPVVSIYLEGQPGRIPEGLKNHLTTQGCSVLVAHKGNDFACHGHPVGNRRAATGAASSASYKSPRQARFETAGFVVSDKHPSGRTFMSDSTADHLLNRYTLAGDLVLVTTFEENPLAKLVLGHGRHLGAFVVDPTKAEDAELEVNEACVTATRHGWFAELNKTKVLMTGSLLPSCVPRHNLSQKVEDDFFTLCGGDEDPEAVEASALGAANSQAEAMGLVIKGSTRHGLGLFATKEIKVEDAIPMAVMGAYEVLTVAEMTEECKADGDPRFPVMEYKELVAVLGDDEIVKEGSQLWLQPTRESPMFYVNSALLEETSLANLVVREASSLPSNAGEAKKMLADASNGVSLTVSRTIRAGEELLLNYPYLADNGDSGDGSQGREKRRRSSRLLAVEGGGNSNAETGGGVLGDDDGDDDDAMDG